MIPLKLSIKNFVSYGPIPQTINFEPYNLICLSGKNGHGKSAIFDAITWAIWGQARKTTGASKPDEGLLKLGESHMSVSLDFVCNNVYYKVKREFGYESKKLISILEFGILDQISGDFKPLTDKTIKHTQNKIEELIGLSFESFINSAFLRQGQSNEFSKKSPSDRKEIIADILGLNKLEELKKRAYEKAKQANTLKANYSQQIDAVKIELENKVDIQAKAFEINDNLKDILFKETLFKSNLAKIKLEEQALLKQKAEYEQIEFQIKHLIPLIQTNTNEIIDNFKAYRTVKKHKNKSINLEKLESDKNSLQKEAHLLSEQNNLYIKLQELLATKAIFLNNYKLQKEQENIKELKNLEDNYQNLLFQKDKLIDQNKKDLKELKKIDLEIKSIENQISSPFDSDLIIISEAKLEKRKAAYHNYQTLSQVLLTELEQNNLNLDLLKEAHKANCPTCYQALNIEKKHDLISSLSNKNRFFNHRINFLNRIVKNLEVLIISQNTYIIRLKSDLEQFKIRQIQKTEYVKLLFKLTESVKKYSLGIEDLNLALEKTVNQIDNIKKSKDIPDSFYKQLNSEIQELVNNINSIDINNINIKSKELNLKLIEIDNKLIDYNNLIKEFTLQEQRKKNISNLVESTKSLKIQKQELSQKLLQLNFHKLSEIAKEEHDLKQNIAQLTSQKEALILQKGSLDQQVTLLEKRQKLLAELKQKLATLNSEYEEYSILSSAFGKDGIQAILIESALPEIELEANSLLARLTNNQAQLSIESLRDLRSGKTKETLDIKIADAAGIRPYEMFSGGEAFRIDFALRIAISKLLARRSGTSLQTLIIDEGFGSQDEEGLSQIMEAIHRIQEDFAKIIIISHLPTMKEQFPVHFLIHKTAYGSAIKVIEQG